MFFAEIWSISNGRKLRTIKAYKNVIVPCGCLWFLERSYFDGDVMGFLESKKKRAVVDFLVSLSQEGGRGKGGRNSE